MRNKPLAIDLYAGLGGWTDGLLAEGYFVVGFDIERHVYGEHRYPAQLVVQDVLTLHGSQFKDATLIVASPPCQKYSYMAMPWKRSKAMAAAIRADESGEALAELNKLFDACFRIQAQASIAAGHHIPMVVENVRGATPWVGRSRWAFGSFHLWGDVPALMPATFRAQKVPGFRFDGSGASFQSASVREAAGVKAGDAGWRERGPGRQLQDRAIKNNGGSWFNVAHNTTSGKGRNPVEALALEGTKQRGSGAAWFDKALDERRKNPDGIKNAGCDLTDIGFNVASAHQFGHMVEGVKIERSAEDKRQHIGTKRKFASAMIAKIPLPLSRHIARTFLP